MPLYLGLRSSQIVRLVRIPLDETYAIAHVCYNIDIFSLCFPKTYHVVILYSQRDIVFCMIEDVLDPFICLNASLNLSMSLSGIAY